jgi:membrane protein YdbS with pleckstrin-like domain
MDAERWDADLRWQVPAPGYRSLRRAEVAVVALLGAAGAGLGFGLGVSTVAGAAAAAAALVAGVAADVAVGRRARSWRFAERGEDLVVARGRLVQRVSIIPYGRMQYVEVSAGPFERAFGLATVRMHTAAAASDARIPGLGGDEAARLRDQLTSLGESAAAGL